MKGLFVLQFVLTNEYDFRRSHRNEIDLKKSPMLSGPGSIFSIEEILLIHGHQELFVIFSLFKTLLDKFHRFDGVHVRKVFAHDPHTL